jgi:hypothetical protein
MPSRRLARALTALAPLLLAHAGAASEPPLPAPVSSAEAVEPAGGRVALSPSTEAIVDPASSFRVVLPGKSEDARLSLLDGRGDLVPGKAAREVGTETVLTVTPEQPLLPAAHYLLRLEGARQRDLHDAAGRAAGPVELHLVVAGSAPEPAKKAVRKKRR